MATAWPGIPALGTNTPRWHTRRSDAPLDRRLVAPFIANRAVALGSETAADLEAATFEIAKLDSSHADDLSALGTLLLCTESVASSKIEQIQANVDDYARANSSAIAMAAATTALQAMIATVGPNAPIRLSAITSAHAALMHDDPLESSAAGELRTVQNWIGGSDFSPRGALYIPPPPETVPGYMDDLVTFADRSDMPALLQAAIAHAHSSRSTPSQTATAASAAP